MLLAVFAVNNAGFDEIMATEKKYHKATGHYRAGVSAWVRRLRVRGATDIG